MKLNKINSKMVGFKVFGRIVASKLLAQLENLLRLRKLFKAKMFKKYKSKNTLSITIRPKFLKHDQASFFVVVQVGVSKLMVSETKVFIQAKNSYDNMKMHENNT